jgi:hypothetical protein
MPVIFQPFPVENVISKRTFSGERMQRLKLAAMASSHLDRLFKCADELLLGQL